MKGWAFDKNYNLENHGGEAVDALYDCKTVYDLYKLADPHFEGEPKLPILWDTVTCTIVNNDYLQICRMLNDEFDEFCENKFINLFP